MFEDQLPKSKSVIEILEKGQSLSIETAAPFDLSFSLPSIEEIVKIRNIKAFLLGAKDLATDQTEVQRGFENEYIRKIRIQSKFVHAEGFQSRLASLSELSGNLERATEHAREASKISDSPHFRNRYGSLLTKRGLYDVAFEVFAEPKLASDSESNLFIALLQMRSQRPKEARRFVNRSLEIDPLNSQARVVSGVISLLENQFKKSIAEFRVAAEDRPADSSIFHGMAVAYLYLGNEEKALDNSRIAHSINPLRENIVRLYSDLLMRKKRFADAIETLGRFINVDPKSTAIVERLALAYYRSDQFARCVETLKIQASLKDTTAVWNNMAVASNRMGNKAKARQYFAHGLSQMLERKTEDLMLIANFMRSLRAEKQYDEAVIVGSRFIVGRSPDTMASQPNLALLFSELLRSQSEVDASTIDIHLLDAVVREPALDVAARVELLIHGSFYHSSRFPDAQKALSYARYIVDFAKPGLGLDNESESLLVNNAIYTFLEQDMISEAELLMPRLMSTVHLHSAPTATFGLYQFKKRRIDKAERLYQEAIGLSKSESYKSLLRTKLYFELARYFQESGDEKKANRYLDKARKKRY